jgi:small subunit ribosomal protein S15e
MIGRYLGEFSLTYKPCRHGKAGVGATKGSAHSSLKWSK